MFAVSLPNSVKYYKTKTTVSTANDSLNFITDEITRTLLLFDIRHTDKPTNKQNETKTKTFL